MTQLIKTDEKYRQWIVEISNRFQKGKIQAAIKVNEEMLKFYWELGHDISEMKKQTNRKLSNQLVNLQNSTRIMMTNTMMRKRDNGQEYRFNGC